MTEPSREQMAERIAEIEKRADEATEGPWEAKCIHVFMDGRGQYSVGARNRPGGFKGTVLQQDAEFVAAARTDVPWLLEQVRVLEERIRKVREMVGEIECGSCDHSVKLHDGGRCTGVVFLDLMCGCTWGNSVADLRAALDGEDEEPS